MCWDIPFRPSHGYLPGYQVHRIVPYILLATQVLFFVKMWGEDRNTAPLLNFVCSVFFARTFTAVDKVLQNNNKINVELTITCSCLPHKCFETCSSCSPRLRIRGLPGPVFALVAPGLRFHVKRSFWQEPRHAT